MPDPNKLVHPFSVDIPGCYPETHYGITLREHYAGLAMQGILANSSIGVPPGVVAESALEHADALLKALEGKP